MFSSDIVSGPREASISRLLLHATRVPLAHDFTRYPGSDGELADRLTDDCC